MFNQVLGEFPAHLALDHLLALQHASGMFGIRGAPPGTTCQFIGEIAGTDHGHDRLGFTELEQAIELVVVDLSHAGPAAQEHRITTGRIQHGTGEHRAHRLQVLIAATGRIERKLHLLLAVQAVDGHAVFVDTHGLGVGNQHIQAQRIFTTQFQSNTPDKP